MPLGRSPLTVDMLPAAAHLPNSVVLGDAASIAVAGVAGSFTLLLRDAFFNDYAQYSQVS